MLFFRNKNTNAELKHKKSAILFYGMLRDFSIPSHSIKNKLITSETEVFFFGPSDTDRPDINYAIGVQDKDGFFIENPKERTQITIPSDKEGFIELYQDNLKKYHFHDKTPEYFDAVSRDLRPREDWLMGLNPARMLSMFYNMGGVIKLFLENKQGKLDQYGRIVITRTDLVIYSDLPCVVDAGCIHIPYGEGFAKNGEKHQGNASVFYYKNMFTGDYVSGGRKFSFNDQIMILHPEDLIVLENLYEDIVDLIKQKAPLSPETLLYILFKRHNMIVVPHEDWAYEIYRRGKKEIDSIMEIEDLKNIDRYNPRFSSEETEELKTPSFTNNDFFGDRSFDFLGKILGVVNKNKQTKLRRKPALFFLDTKSSMNKIWKNKFLRDMANMGTMIFLPSEGSIKSDSGKVVSNQLKIQAETPCYLVYGPFINIDRGEYIAKISFSHKISPGTFIVDVICEELGEIFTQKFDVAQEEHREDVDVKWNVEKDVSKLEIRIYALQSAECCLDYVAIRKIT